MSTDTTRDRQHNASEHAGYSAGDIPKADMALNGAGVFRASGGRFAPTATSSDDALLYLSAAELLALFKARKVSPVELLRAQIARYERIGDKVNCVTYTHFDTAMEAAKVSERRWLQGTARPLEGITCGVKDEHYDAGWMVTAGLNMHQNQRMQDADPIVAKLKAAGAVLPIQTTVPELYLHGITFSKRWGVSRNPWNLKYTVGGSSGGALAAGLCTIATGSDMGGSIRIPCACNGLYGFKPPYGRVTSGEPLSMFSGSGPMARALADLVMMQNAIAGQTPHAPSTLPKVEMPLDYPSVKGLRIAYSPNLNYVKIDSETQQNLKVSVERLRDLGAEPVEIELDIGTTFDEMTEKWNTLLLSSSLGGWLAGYLPHLDELSPYAAWYLSKLNQRDYGPKELYAFEHYLMALYARIADQVWNKGFDALITATLNTSHLPADFDHAISTFEIEGVMLSGLFFTSLTAPWNLLNWCPVVAAPTGISSQGMPIGMQIIGAPYQDHTAFRIAHGHEGASPRLFQGDRIPAFRDG